MSEDYDWMLLGEAEFLTIKATNKPFTHQPVSVRITDVHPQYQNVKDTQEGSVATLNGVCYTVQDIRRCNIGNCEWVDIELVEKVIETN